MKGMTANFFSPLSFVAAFRSGIRDLGSGIQDPGWVKTGSGIQDKHPRSTTLAGRFTLKKLECSKQALALEYLLLLGIREEDVVSILLVFGNRHND